jgi:hypothetical protein
VTTLLQRTHREDHDNKPMHEHAATVCLAPSAGPGGGCPGHRKMTGQVTAMTDPLSRRCRATLIAKEAFDTAARHKRKSRMRQEGRREVSSGAG